jgi:hypothetical protein
VSLARRKADEEQRGEDGDEEMADAAALEEIPLPVVADIPASIPWVEGVRS